VFFNLNNKMRVREEKIMVELVGCHYNWDGLPSPSSLSFFS